MKEKHKLVNFDCYALQAKFPLIFINNKLLEQLIKYLFQIFLIHYLHNLSIQLNPNFH